MNIIYRIFIGGIIFNVLFSGFSYGLTTFADQPSDLIDIDIDQETLLKEGILLVNATRFNVTFKDGWHYYTMNEVKQRVKWDSDLVRGDGFSFQKQNFLAQQFDSWLLPQYVGVWFGESKTGIIDGFCTNSSIISHWDITKNYTRINLETSDLCFVRTLAADNNNITKAIQETGTVTLTIADGLLSADQTVEGFVKWYWANLFNWSYSGVPWSVTVFIKVIVFVNLASAIIVIRELFKL